MSEDRAPARRQDDEGRRAALIAAASRVISQHGIAAATTRRIAEEAGVPAGLVHYWFSGKDELLEAVIADTLGEIESAVDEADADTADVDTASSSTGAPSGTGAPPTAGAASSGVDAEALEQRLLAAFRTVESDDRGRQVAMYEMTTWALRKPSMSSVAQHQYEAYRRLAASGLAAAGLDVDAEPAMASLVAALFDGLTLSWLADPEGTDPEAVLDLFARLVAALRRPAG